MKGNTVYVLMVYSLGISTVYDVYESYLDAFHTKCMIEQEDDNTICEVVECDIQ